MDRKRSLAIGAITIVAAAACGGAQPAQSGPLSKVGGITATTLKPTLLTVIGPDLELNFADSAKRLSSSAIEITVTGNWRPDDVNNESDLVKEVASGRAELGYIGARGFDTVGVNSFVGLQAPMLVDSAGLEAKVLATDWAKKLLDGPRSIGVVGLGYVQGELRQPLGITRNLAQVSDFQGARIGARPSHVTDMTMKALGATTVAIPAASVNLSGLDGIEMGAPAVAGNRYDEGSRSFTGNVVFWARPNVIFANAKWFDGLSADQQGQLRAAAAETDRRSAAIVVENAKESRSILCARGFPIASASAAALAGFRTRLQPVVDELAKDPATKATIDAIRALRGATDAPDVVAPCPRPVPTSSPRSGPTALDGSWKTSFTKADLATSPLLIDNGEINDENWGDLTMTFANGRFTSTQRNDVAHSSGSGTYAVTGDVLYLSIDQTGEKFAYRWSIYRDTLTLKRDDTLGFGGPTPNLIKPWTRVP